MSPRMTSFPTLAAIVALTLLGVSRDAQALDMTVDVVPPAQVPPFTSRARLGHLVYARTSLISLAAGGTYRVACASPHTLPLEGQNGLSVFNLPPNVMSVEVPAGPLPAVREIPGFFNVPGGTSVACAYYWTAMAKDAMYSLGSGPIRMPIGGDPQYQGDSKPFEMYKPGSSGDDDNNGCVR
jgi:hypothetical protein